MSDEQTTQGLKYPDDYRPKHKLDTVTAKNFTPERGSEHLFWYKMEAIQTNTQGTRTSTPRLQTATPGMWSKEYLHLMKLGYTVVVLYDPTEYRAKMQAAVEKANTPVDVNKMVSEALATKEAEKEAELAEMRKEMEEMRELVKSARAEALATKEAEKVTKKTKTKE